jgi:microsomal dipeptidase-like Zn-dependent dipeptidase
MSQPEFRMASMGRIRRLALSRSVLGLARWQLGSLAFAAAVISGAACADDEATTAVPPLPPPFTVHSVANACVTVSTGGSLALAPTGDGAGFAFSAGSGAARFRFRATDLGTYLLRDTDGAYLVGDAGALTRTTSLLSDTLLNDDSYVSPAEWVLEASPTERARFRMKHLATGAYLAGSGLAKDASGAASLALDESQGCAEFPELAVDASGSVARTHFADGTLFGVVDAHSHLFSNFGFGGGGVFHGSPFHRLGVEHALPDCSPFHGEDGRHDVLGYFFNGSDFDVSKGASTLLTGTIPEFDHHTAGYPDFTDWPRAKRNSTHQTQYYRWIERAYLGGLRLIVQHATSNQVLCDLMTGIHAQDKRFSCNEMVSAEREIDETYALERYIDAQAGGPGLGWFHVVTSPAAAREVIGAGKLAVVLGIETSNVMDCFLTPRAGFPACDPTIVRERLDHLRERGVRAIFPVHKFDNAFSAGDGHRGFIELGSLLNTGHYSNFTLDCENWDTGFDHGDVNFGGLNMPREVYDSPPPLDIINFGKAPTGALLPLLDPIKAPPLKGQYCQKTGLTPLGETLIHEMMRRGMIIEIDHLPQRSYARAIEMLEESDYPAAGTHGRTAHNRLYALGGISTSGLPRCGGDPAAISAAFRARFDAIAAAGAYRAQGFGFDLNGLAGVPGPRFPPDGCSEPQQNPVTYPFTSYAGDVTFTAPRLAKRSVDFNTEGMIHIGLMPELIEDARHIGLSDDDLEPLFRSAEGYLRMWERAEARGAIIAAAP